MGLQSDVLDSAASAIDAYIALCGPLGGCPKPSTTCADQTFSSGGACLSCFTAGPTCSAASSPDAPERFSACTSKACYCNRPWGGPSCATAETDPFCAATTYFDPTAGVCKSCITNGPLCSGAALGEAPHITGCTATACVSANWVGHGARGTGPHATRLTLALQPQRDASTPGHLCTPCIHCLGATNIMVAFTPPPRCIPPTPLSCPLQFCAGTWVGDKCAVNSAACPAKTFFNPDSQSCESCSASPSGPGCSDDTPGRYSGCTATSCTVCQAAAPLQLMQSAAKLHAGAGLAEWSALLVLLRPALFFFSWLSAPSLALPSDLCCNPALGPPLPCLRFQCSKPWVGPTCRVDSTACPPKTFFDFGSFNCTDCSTAGPLCSAAPPGRPDRFSSCTATTCACVAPWAGNTCDSPLCPAKTFFDAASGTCASCEQAGPRCSPTPPGGAERYSECTATSCECK